jgi:diguanylate cyclase (GGDEF)-like protein
VEQALARDRWRTRALEAGPGADALVAEATAELADELRRERERRLRAEEELQRATHEMTRSMQVDPLTGIHNRSSLDAALEREWAAHVASRRPLALLMVDVDHFKPYNDRYGHLQGDASLRAVADLLRVAARRGGDLAARYGGEEFAVVLPDSDVQTAEDVADGILRSVRSAGIPHADAPAGVLTVSVGIAVCIPAAEWAHTDLVRAADEALYRAKAMGRDRSVTTVTVPPVTDPPGTGSRALAAPASRRALEGPRH